MVKVKHYCNLDDLGLTFAVFVVDTDGDPDNVVVLKRGLSKAQMETLKLKLSKLIDGKVVDSEIDDDGE